MKTAKQLQREAKKMFRLCMPGGSLDEIRVRQAVKTVLDAKRRGCLTLLSRFQHLVKLERSKRRAEVHSAALLPADLQADVISNLERRYGSGLSTCFELDPSLIGGMRIQVGSDLYDGSVRAELASLQKNF